MEREPFHGFPWYLEDVCEALQEIATTCSSHHFEVPKDISGKPPPSHLGQIIWDAHLRRKGYKYGLNHPTHHENQSKILMIYCNVYSLVI